MNPILVYGLQFGIAAIVAAVAILFFRMKPLYVFGAILLSMPLPALNLFKSQAGFLYFADIIGWSFFIAFLLGKLPFVLRSRTLFYFSGVSALLLFIWPLFATSINGLFGGVIDWKVIGQDLIRGIGYFGAFVGAMQFSKDARSTRDALEVSFVFLCGIFSCGLLQFTLSWDLDYWNYFAGIKTWHTAEFTTSFGTGFMGLYRGAIGAWGACLLSICLPLLSSSKFFRWFCPIFIIVIVSGILGVGSRQGLLIAVAGLVMSLFFLDKSDTNRGKVSRQTILWTGVLFLCMSASSLKSIDYKTSLWILTRFSNSETNRGNVFDVTGAFIDQPLALIGTGSQPPLQLDWIGKQLRVPPQPDPTKYQMVYVDSELVWVLQQQGVFAVLVYVAFLFAVAFYLWKSIRFAYGDSRVLIMAGILVMLTGLLLTLGHYFLLHTPSSQAPLSYWQWSVLGAALGTALRARTNQRRIVSKQYNKTISL